MKILAVGGGSGGHVTPVAAVLSELAKEQDAAPDVLFVCDKGFARQSRGIMGELSFPVTVKTIPSGRLRRYAHFHWYDYIRHFSIVLHNSVDIFKTIAGFFKALWTIARFRPDVVFAKGGFVCLPVGYAAHLCRVPLVIHDSDARPGLTNKLLARFATSIGTGMPVENYTYPKDRTVQVGVPINLAIRPVTAELQRAYRDELELPQHKKLVVAVGGGLGSVAINTAMINMASHWDGQDVLFYNVVGTKNIDDVMERAKGLENYQAVSFIYKDMYKLLGAADIVVTRASATTLQELAALKKPVVAVPAHQLGDQQQNAALFAAYDAVITLQDGELLDALPATITKLLSDEAACQSLAKNIHEFARPHAARDMAELIRKAAK